MKYCVRISEIKVDIFKKGEKTLLFSDEMIELKIELFNITKPQKIF